MVVTWEGEGAAPIAVRGSPKRITDLMEAFQEAFVRGVAAAAGCCVAGKPEIDEGVDINLTHRASIHRGDEEAWLQIQMKSSSAGPVEDGKFVKAKLSRDRYDFFRYRDPTINKIVVILHMPSEQENWLRVGDDALMMRHRAYWVNLRGAPSMETESITIKAPTSQVFDDIALCNMMARIGQGGHP